MGSSSQRLCPSSAAGTVGRSWSSGVHERHPPLDPYAVCPMGQVKHTVPVRRALGFVLGQREGRTHRNLMPPDPHVAHFDGESGGKDGDAAIVDALERLVIDRIPLKQYAHGCRARRSG